MCLLFCWRLNDRMHRLTSALRNLAAAALALLFRSFASNHDLGTESVREGHEEKDV